jgi:hypothetical protein
MRPLGIDANELLAFLVRFVSSLIHVAKGLANISKG